MALPNAEKEKAVQMVIDDLRRLYDRVASNYGNLKNRVLGLIAGEVAIASFVFSGDDFNVTTFTPAEKIFMGVGILLLAVAFGLLLWIVATADWQVPLDLKESRKLYQRYNSTLHYLEEIKEDYENCTEYCVAKLSSRATAYNRSLFILSSGIIIMLVIKFAS